MAYSQGKKQSVETIQKEAKTLDLLDEDLHKEVKKTKRVKSYQIDNINKREIIKQN